MQKTSTSRWYYEKYYEPLLSIGVGELKLYYSIDEFIIEKYNYSNSACPNCDYIQGEILDKSAEYFYSNIKLPSILTFELIYKQN